VKPDGMTGTAVVNFAREINGLTGLPVGTFVFLYPGYADEWNFKSGIREVASTVSYTSSGYNPLTITTAQESILHIAATVSGVIIDRVAKTDGLYANLRNGQRLDVLNTGTIPIKFAHLSATAAFSKLRFAKACNVAPSFGEQSADAWLYPKGRFTFTYNAASQTWYSQDSRPNLVWLSRGGALNDFDASNLPDSLGFSATSAITLTGLAGGIEGHRLTVFSAGGYSVTLKHDDAGSASGNRFSFADSADVELGDMESVSLVYFLGAWTHFAEAAAGGVSLPDGDYGDITVGGSGTTLTIDDDTIDVDKLQDDAVETDKIQDAAVTLDKINSSAGYTGTIP